MNCDWQANSWDTLNGLEYHFTLEDHETQVAVEKLFKNISEILLSIAFSALHFNNNVHKFIKMYFLVSLFVTFYTMHFQTISLITFLYRKISEK